jgi:hypothetical protein
MQLFKWRSGRGFERSVLSLLRSVYEIDNYYKAIKFFIYLFELRVLLVSNVNILFDCSWL